MLAKVRRYTWALEGSDNRVVVPISPCYEFYKACGRYRKQITGVGATTWTRNSPSHSALRHEFVKAIPRLVPSCLYISGPLLIVHSVPIFILYCYGLIGNVGDDDIWRMARK